jgi:hypothetical protein
VLDKQIKHSVDQELATKGLQRVEDDSANLYIGYQKGSARRSMFRRTAPVGAMARWNYGHTMRLRRPKEVGPIPNVRYGNDLTDP